MKLDRVIAVRNSKTVFRDGDKCIKVFNKEHSKAQVLGEGLNHALVEQCGLPVPELLEVVQIDGKWAIVMEYIRGSTLAQRMEREPENRQQLMERFVDLQLTVHRTDCAGLGSVHEQLRQQLAGVSLEPALRQQMYRLLDRQPGSAGLCHGDFDPSNIIVTEEGRVCILDWSRAAIGDGALDAAGTLLQFLLRGEEDAARSYVKLYCAGSGIDPQQLWDRLPVVAAARMARGFRWEQERLERWLISPQSGQRDLSEEKKR